jgi:succinate dehydrogenase / fumarate reductase iron-sulfur subunit
MRVTIKVQRYLPDTDAGSNGAGPERRIDEFTVEMERDDATFLDVLDRVKDEQDGTLTYRKSCRSAICGSCAMRVDGHAHLVCKTQVKPFVDRGETPLVSPMGNMPPIKDLVVDMSLFWEKIKAIKPYLMPDEYREAPEKERIVAEEKMQEVYREANCIMCGACVSECNSWTVNEKFLGPAALAKAFRFAGDARDSRTSERLEMYSEPNGIWDCTRCYHCNQKCPKDVRPRDAIAKIGAAAYNQGIQEDKGAKHAKAFLHSVKRGGMLNETRLVAFTNGMVGAGLDTPFAVRMTLRGKANPFEILVHHKIDNLESVRSLIKHTHEEPIGTQDPPPPKSSTRGGHTVTLPFNTPFD